jgi:predicted metal-dependent phosphoesterase TrpH
MTSPAGSRADLHTHTRASDGSLSAAELVARAAACGVSTLSITDHDTMASVREAIVAGATAGVRVVPGVELSVRVPVGTMHLLGYFHESEPPSVIARLAELREGRVRRAERIVTRLAGLGAPIEIDRVRARAAGAVGRPHIADELVAAGHVPTRQAAFERYLADGGPAWVPTEGLSPRDAIDLVREAGGAPALAHPASLRMGTEQLSAFVQRLAGQGLAGIEVHRPEHGPERRHELRRIARRFGLVATGGSDFHHPGGLNEPGDTGIPPLPPDAAERLLATCAR